MKILRWIWAGAVVLVALPGCDSGRLIPEDIESLMNSEGGRLVLKAVEGHGGIWRWRQRPYTSFDYVNLVVKHGMDTAVTNRRRDTTITPRVDTTVNVRETVTFDLQNLWAYAVSASQNPLTEKGMNADSSWRVQDGMPDTTADAPAAVTAHLQEALAHLSLPFRLLDTTLGFSATGVEPYVDTTFAKGKNPGTYDTTMTPFNLVKLRVDFPTGTSDIDWMVLYVDERDGRIRRTLSPVMVDDSTRATYLTIWSDLQDAIGLTVGGRRNSYPATDQGQVMGLLERDRRYYNVEFPRSLDSDPFTWMPPAPVDSTADTTAVPPEDGA
jgi:hypothetical protein